MKKEFPQKFKSDTTEVQASNSKPAQTVASARRTTNTGRRTVKLTPSQVAIAKKLGVPLEEYAKHVKEA
jgi:phage I-like protein